tara:strand:+ start:168 stop:476 length:309 start_codon:yes stop_codon:yes gene_type:complete
MPLYDFLNNETGEIEEHTMSYTKLDQFKLDNPHLKQVILGTPSIVGGYGDRVKTDDGFKEVLSKVADANKGSNLDQYRKRTAKEVKTKQIIQKHVDLQSRKK